MLIRQKSRGSMPPKRILPNIVFDEAINENKDDEIVMKSLKKMNIESGTPKPKEIKSNQRTPLRPEVI